MYVSTFPTHLKEMPYSIYSLYCGNIQFSTLIAPKQADNRCKT